MAIEKTLKSWYKKWWAITLFIFFGLIVISSLVDNDNSINQQNTLSQQQNEVADIMPNQAFLIAYEIVESEDQSHKALGNKLFSDYTTQEINALPMDKKMLYRIVVSPEIKEDEVHIIIQKIISDITEKDNDIDEIILFLYSDKELSSRSYDIGTATWAPKGELGNVTSEIAQSNDRMNYEITIQIKENLEEYLSQRMKFENKLGLTEEQRRQFFKEIVTSEDRANSEAEKLYTIDITNSDYKQENLIRNIDKADELMEKYKAEIRIKYNLTEEQLTEIITEAFKEGWSLE